MPYRLLMPILVALSLSGCAASSQGKIGQEMLLPWVNGPMVYRGNISRKYTSIKTVQVRLRQIAGPNCHDDLNTPQRLSHQAAALGADAVINYTSKRIPGENILDPGYFEASGTAVKFVK